LNETTPSANSPIQKDTFWTYVRTQKKMILIASVISTACFTVLKYCFPYPDFFVDSINYVLWAVDKFDVAYRPTGYSYFLRLTHTISASATFTVFIQYLLFFLSSLFFFFSADYLFGLPAKLKWLLLIIIVINPILVFQTNLISSDSLFCSLTVSWFTLCLWIVRRPGWLVMMLQSLVLYLSFSVRYAAMFYPLITIVAFILSVSGKWYKLTGIALTAGSMLFAIERQANANEQETGTRTFSGFSGWQIANNALYCYKKISVNTIDLPTSQTQVIDALVKRYIDSVDAPDAVGYVYLWDKNSPLKKYLHVKEYRDHIDYFKAWFAVSGPMSDYGWYIVRNYPGAFTRYYILPNTLNYFYPDKEIMANYNASGITLSPETKAWFDMDADNLSCRFPDLQKNIIAVYPACSLLLNVFSIVAILLFLSRNFRSWKKTRREVRSLFLLWCCFYFVFMAFTIFATAVSLRYMDPFYIIGLVIPFILIRKEKYADENGAG
jgi:hypothetical protein